MRQKIKVSRLADSTDDFVVVSWLVSVGDKIEAGAPLVVLETDKTEVEMDSPVAGTVVEFLADDGDDVRTGQPICVVEA